MAQEALIDRHLSELHHEMGNALLVVSIYLDLPRNRAHLLRLLHSMLLRLTDHVQAALEVWPAEDVDGNPKTWTFDEDKAVARQHLAASITTARGALE